MKLLQAANRTPRAAVIAAQCLLAAAAATLLIWPEWAPGISALSVALLLLFIWSLVSWRLAGRSLFSPYILFLTSAFLFNAGQPFLEVFGLNGRGILGGVFDEETVVTTLVLVLTALSSLHTAALLGSIGRVREIARRDSSGAAPWTRGIAWMLIGVALPPTVIWLVQAVSIAASAGYGALYDRDLQTGVITTSLLLSGWLVPGMLFLTVSGRTNRTDARVATVLMLAFVLAQLYIGYRSTAVMPLVAWLWLRHRAVKPVKLGLLAAVGVALLIVVFPLIRETRAVSGEERSLSTLSAWFDPIDNPAVSSISEMGGSMRTIAYTTALVPSSRPFDQGLGYAYGALTLFPNLFWPIHPTVARGIYSDWLVTAVDPWAAAHGGSLGFSFIAEAYLNFGPFGPMLVMIILGFLLGKTSCWADHMSDPAALAMIATILAFILRFPRDETASMLRPIVWYAIAPYLAARWLPKFTLGAIRTVPSAAGHRSPSDRRPSPQDVTA